MREEYDFSKGERGKFFQSDMKLNIPIHLDDEVSAFVEKIALKKGVDRSSVVNGLLNLNSEVDRELTPVSLSISIGYHAKSQLRRS
jgi:hypothetical protein